MKLQKTFRLRSGRSPTVSLLAHIARATRIPIWRQGDRNCHREMAQFKATQKRQDMFRTLNFAVLALLAIACGGTAHAQVPSGYPADYGKIVDAAKKEGKVVVYSTTDSKLVTPLIKDFEAAFPGVKCEYTDLNSTEVYNRFISENAANATSADAVWSSSMDLQMKLAADGFAAPYKSPEIAALPDWAHFKDTVYATTFEPIAILYNNRLIPPEDV